MRVLFDFWELWPTHGVFCGPCTFKGKVYPVRLFEDSAHIHAFELSDEVLQAHPEHTVVAFDVVEQAHHAFRHLGGFIRPVAFPLGAGAAMWVLQF